MKKIGLIGILFTLFLISGCVKEGTINTEEYCTADSGEKMSLSEAVSIASDSECVVDGSLTEISMCNSVTGTWWIDLDVYKKGCAPACVINVITKEAEINWRCTGLIME